MILSQTAILLTGVFSVVKSASTHTKSCFTFQFHKLDKSAGERWMWEERKA